ncbi:MAG: phosphohydrolase [Chloroflexi bacterium]|nr:phosphohydrolase [Chloroflexota bacterium]
MNDTLVIYHGGCADGFTAAWAFKALRPAIQAVYHPGRHGDPPPDVKDKDVYILDFSYPRETLLRMKDDAASLLVLDHHKTAEADLEGLPFCVFDMERSGAGITWDHLAAEGDPPPKRPWLVDVVEDRDLWRYRFGDQTRHTASYMATVPMTFDAWDDLANGGLDAAAAKGAAIQSYIDSYGVKACQHAIFRDLGGFTVPVINIFYENCSDHVHRLCSLHPERPFGASFYLRDNGRWQFSLRSIGDFDVSEVARKWGGGGHKNAAGFEVDTLPWEAPHT